MPPAVLFPHGALSNSPAGIACDTSGGKFGPFENQLFVAEQTKSRVLRVDMETLELLRGLSRASFD